MLGSTAQITAAVAGREEVGEASEPCRAAAGERRPGPTIAVRPAAAGSGQEAAPRPCVSRARAARAVLEPQRTFPTRTLPAFTAPAPAPRLRLDAMVLVFYSTGTHRLKSRHHTLPCTAAQHACRHSRHNPRAAQSQHAARSNSPALATHPGPVALRHAARRCSIPLPTRPKTPRGWKQRAAPAAHIVLFGIRDQARCTERAGVGRAAPAAASGEGQGVRTTVGGGGQGSLIVGGAQGGL